MKQLFFQGGHPIVAEVPPPALEPGRILVRLRASAVSPGTELSNLERSGKSFLALALEKRRRVDRLITAIRRRDFRDIVDRVTRLEQRTHAWSAAGYSAAGTVTATAPDSNPFAPGDRVAVVGAGFASHADQVVVPRNLAVRIPPELNFEAASTAALGAIAMQAVRRAETALGEVTLVLGLGVLGQLAVRLLLAAGARVLAWDPDADRLALAASIGAEPLLSRDSEEVAEATTRATRGRGADQVILAASAGPAAVASAALATRRHGVLVLLGLTPVSVPREIAYERELDLRMSTSYGPGRYDPEYEERGRDYPFAHVRWTEGRNVEAYLELLARGRISLDGLFEQVDGLEKAAEGYARLRAKGAAPGLIFRYDEGSGGEDPSRAVTSSGAAPAAVAAARGPTAAPVRVAVLGVGGYTANSILPELARLEGRARLALLAGSVPARREPLARAHKFDRTSERYEDAAVDPAVDLVVIATRHDRHAALIERALAAGRAVFCEKPLALTSAEIERIASALAARADAFLTLGFNRRFAPTVVRWKEELRARRGPLHLDYRVQAGPLPEGHWLRTAEGGGRLLGEAVHMIDLLRHLVGQPLEAAQVMGGGSGPDRDPGADNFQLMLRYRDGSSGSLLYTSRGSSKHPKERIEGHWDGRTIELDDFTALREAGRNDLLWSAPRADKGQRGLWSACLDALLRGAPSPTPSDELLETARAAVALDAALRDAP